MAKFWNECDETLYINLCINIFNGEIQSNSNNLIKCSHLSSFVLIIQKTTTIQRPSFPVRCMGNWTFRWFSRVCSIESKIGLWKLFPKYFSLRNCFQKNPEVGNKTQQKTFVRIHSQFCYLRSCCWTVLLCLEKYLVLFLVTFGTLCLDVTLRHLTPS